MADLPPLVPTPRPQTPTPTMPGDAPPAVERGPVEFHRLHLYQFQWVRDLMVVGALVGLVYVGYLARVVTIPLLLALMLAYLFEPVVRRLCRLPRMSRAAAAALIIFGATFALIVPLVIGVGFATVQGISYAAEIAANVGEVRRSVDEVRERQAKYDQLRALGLTKWAATSPRGVRTALERVAALTPGQPNGPDDQVPELVARATALRDWRDAERARDAPGGGGAGGADVRTPVERAIEGGETEGAGPAGGAGPTTDGTPDVRPTVGRWDEQGIFRVAAAPDLRLGEDDITDVSELHPLQQQLFEVGIQPSLAADPEQLRQRIRDLQRISASEERRAETIILAEQVAAEPEHTVRAGTWQYIRNQVVRIRAGDDGRPVAESTTIDNMISYAITWVEANATAIATSVGRTALGTGADAALAALRLFVSIGFLFFSLFLTALFFFFFSTGWGRVLEFWEGLIPERKKWRTFRIILEMDAVIAGFVRGRLTIVGLLTIYMTAAYWLIGVPAPLIVGPLVGLLFIAPFVHIIGVPVAILLMFLHTGGDGPAWQQEWWWILAAPTGVYLIAQVLDDWILSPVIQGQTTNLDTPTIVFASIAGGALAGVYGLLLAIPAAACLKVLIREFVWPRIDDWVKGRASDVLPLPAEPPRSNGGT